MSWFARALGGDLMSPGSDSIGGMSHLYIFIGQLSGIGISFYFLNYKEAINGLVFSYE